MSRYNITVIYNQNSKLLHDSNATIGYDEGLESWFIQGFEGVDSEENEGLGLWLGTKYREFSRLENLLIALNNVKIIILNEKNHNLYDFFPTSESYLSKLFIKHLSKWALIDRRYTENPESYANIDFKEYIQDYENEIEEADEFVQNFAQNVDPEDVEILKEIYYAYSALFKNNIECACVRSVMNQNWNGIHGWMK